MKTISLFRLTEIEGLKLRNSAIWFAIIGLPLVGVLIGTGSFAVNIGYLSGDPWFQLWTQVALFYGYIFYPLLIAVLAAYLFRIERLEKNWNSLLTYPISATKIWFSKLLLLYILAFITQAIMIFFYFLSGTFLLRLSGTMPSYFWWWLIAGPTYVMAFGAIECYLALCFKSFSFPIAVGFFMSFAGLFCYANGIWIFPNTLAIIGINAQHEGIPTQSEIIKTGLGVIMWIVIFSVLGIKRIRDRKIF